jgi:hypothetical protein
LPRKLMHRKDMQVQVIRDFLGLQDLLMNHAPPLCLTNTTKHNGI